MYTYNYIYTHIYLYIHICVTIHEVLEGRQRASERKKKNSWLSECERVCARERGRESTLVLAH